LTQLWHGEGSVSHWVMVLLYTHFWLSLSRVMVPDDRVNVATAMITVRVIIYSGFFLAALGVLNDW